MVANLKDKMIIDCISDLHGHYPELEGGDLLIVAGDLTAHSGEYEINEFSEWLESLNYPRIVVIAGNHDWYCETFPDTLFGIDNVEYLCNSETEFGGLKIWGSPWTLRFHGMNPKCMAFTCDTEKQLAEKWKLIPTDVDILVTHSPPFGIMDEVKRYDFDHNSHIENTGSMSLRETIDRIKPKLHVFGHIHEHGGKQMLYKHAGPNTIMVNAAHVNERYRPVNTPVRVILS